MKKKLFVERKEKMNKENQEKLVRVHLTLLQSDYATFKKMCKDNFSSISSELKRLIRHQLNKGEC